MGKTIKFIIEYQGILLALLISLCILGPYTFQSGYFFTLDWPMADSFGLVAEQYYPNQVPFIWLFEALNLLVPVFILQKIIIGGILLLGYWSMSKLLKSTPWISSKLGIFAGSLFFIANPFVLERLAQGQVFILLAYSLLPLFVWALFQGNSYRSKWWIGITSLLLIMLLASPHFSYFIGVLIVAYCIITYPDKKSLKTGGFTLLILAILSAGISMLVSSGTNLWAFNRQDIINFAFYTPSWENSIITFLLGRGFWAERGQVFPAHMTDPLTIYGLITALVIGAWWLLRIAFKYPLRVSLTLVGILIVSILLSLGIMAPGAISDAIWWLYEYIPGYLGMRDSQKWSVLFVFLISGLVGFGLSEIPQVLRKWPAQSIGTVLVISVIIGVLPIFWGISGRIQARDFPRDWYTFREKLKGVSWDILVLPWHQSSSFEFTSWKVIAHPAGQFFRANDLIVPDNIEIWGTYSQSRRPTSRILEKYLRNPELYQANDFKQELRNLDIRHVILFKGLDADRYIPLVGSLIPSISNESIELYSVPTP